MALEIERKFLVTGDGWRAGASAERIRQGYLAREAGNVVRVRLIGPRAVLTVKGGGEGLERREFEYEIPPGDAEAMLRELCPKPLIEKTRYRLRHAGLGWEVDVFDGANAGLVLAEAELASPDQPVELPPWAGREVTHDPRFYNARLAVTPFDPRWLEEAP